MLLLFAPFYLPLLLYFGSIFGFSRGNIFYSFIYIYYTVLLIIVLIFTIKRPFIALGIIFASLIFNFLAYSFMMAMFSMA